MTTPVIPAGNAALQIGKPTVGPGTSEYFQGYIDDFRVTTGLVRHNSAFPLPNTEALVVSPTSDEYWNSVSSLLHFDGVSGSTTFTDAKGKTFTATGVAGAVAISTVQSVFGGSSGLFNGATQTSIATPAHVDYMLGQFDFTIECWIYVTATNTNANTIMSSWDGANYRNWQFYLDSSNYLIFAWTVDGITGGSITSIEKISLNTWYHVAVCRLGQYFLLYINGKISSIGPATTIATGINNTVPHFCIGNNYEAVYSSLAGWAFNGYIDEVRVTKGYCRYPGEFSVPIAAFAESIGTTGDLLYPSTTLLVRSHGSVGSSSFVDESSYVKTLTPVGSVQMNTPSAGDQYFANVILQLSMDGTNSSTTFTDSKGHTVTPRGVAMISTAQYKFPVSSGSSALFNGSTDSLLISPTDFNDFDFGNRDFTVECWIRPVVLTTGIIYVKRVNNTVYSPLVFYMSSAGAIIITSSFDGASWAVSITSATTVAINTWSHVACVRRGSNWNIFINGVLDANSAIASGTVMNNSARPTIASELDGFTNLFNGYIDDYRITKGVARYTSTFTLPTAANPTAGGYTSGAVGAVFPAIYFSGSSDAISVASNSHFNFGITSGSVDFWMFPTSISGKPWLYQFEIDASNRWGMYLDAGIIKLSCVNGGVEIIHNTNYLVQTNSLYHIEVDSFYNRPFNGRQIRVYVNGVPYYVPNAGTDVLLSSLLSERTPVSGVSYNYLKNQFSANKSPLYVGSYYIAGTTKTSAGTPYAANVLIFPDNAPSLCIASAFTDSITGTFSINNLAAGKYMIVAYDTTGLYNDVVYDHVTSVPM